MNVFESLKSFIMNLFSGKRAHPKTDRTATEAEKDKTDPVGLETRCVNPDIGCRFEVS
jgi:hypothetical protein